MKFWHRSAEDNLGRSERVRPERVVTILGFVAILGGGLAAYPEILMDRGNLAATTVVIIAGGAAAIGGEVARFHHEDAIAAAQSNTPPVLETPQSHESAA